MKKGYLGLTHIFLPRYCLEKAFGVLRESGEKQLEGLALLAGKMVETEFFVERVIIPEYSSYREEEGLFYAIGAEELYRLNVMLHANKLKLIAQIHSHPGAAYHSEADDRYAVVTKVGGLSIVVPNFAFGPVDIENCAVYRLSENNEWIGMSTAEVNRLILVV